MSSDDHKEIPLVNFQQWMMQMLLDPYQQAGPASKLLPVELQGAKLSDVVNHSDKLPAHEHLAIYQRSYIARLRSCMSQQFTALEYALGEDLFCAFADEYLTTHPSGTYNLADLGVRFAAYLEANRPDRDSADREDWPDFMIELAHLEQTVNIAFEEQAEEEYELATMDSAETDLKLLPVSYLFAFRFPTRWFYSEFKNNKSPEIPGPNVSYAMIHRYNYQIALFDLHKEQHELLSYLKEGLSVPAAKMRFCAEHPNEASQFEAIWPAWKKRWIEAKFFRV